MLQDLGSCPATMEASKAADCYGSAPGHDIQIADAVQAYIQAELKGNATWIVLPPEERPKSWSKYRKPVVRLRKALYGHPDSGTFWEKHCDKHVKSVGYKPVSEEWPSCYFHAGLKLLLIIYVDDFKLAGPRTNIRQGWSLVSKGLKIEPPTPLGVYLGCGHEVREVKLPNGTIRVVSYNMEAFLTSCVDRYLELAGSGYKLRHAATPFLADDPANSPAAAPQPGSNGVACPWCKHTFDATKTAWRQQQLQFRGGPP